MTLVIFRGLLGALLFLFPGQPMVVSQVTVAVTGSADQLVGLWKAKERFGPDARGPLIIKKDGANYIAEMMGRILPVEVRDGELTFNLPNKQGGFRGKLEGKDILGHWFQPGTIVNGFGYAAVTATPVALAPAGVDRWSGSVDPAPDESTFYLIVEKRPDGSFGVLVRNPERDLGNMMRIDRLTRDGDIVESDVYRRGKKPARYSYRPPVALNDGWPTGTLDEVNVGRAELEKLVQSIIDTPETAPDTPQIHGC